MYWINHFLNILIVETTSKRSTRYISNIQTTVYCFMLKNLLNPLTVKRYFIYGSYKNYCYLRLRKTYIQQPRTRFRSMTSFRSKYFGGLDCRSERVKAAKARKMHWPNLINNYRSHQTSISLKVTQTTYCRIRFAEKFDFDSFEKGNCKRNICLVAADWLSGWKEPDKKVDDKRERKGVGK